MPLRGELRYYPGMTTDTANAGACPLCEGENQCAIAKGEAPQQCWCMSATLDPGALQRAAALPGERRCICAACGAIKHAQGDAG
ncbi:cysteine-rich CWC family protein [Spongiibacter sp. UBA1325]|uniref:cysteine-rich CWC family protein n=1 Tax=Spongiibacter sp. UBA1325 TaxID=1947543 RepID=UPI0039C99A4B